MLLAIDSGNTQIVFAIYDQQKPVGYWRIANDSKLTADQYAVWISQLLALERLSFADIDDVIIASVVPETLVNLIEFCRLYPKIEPLIIGRDSCKLGIKIILDHPEQVGADRLVNAIAGHQKYGGPLIIIDFGTATTFDVVDDQGNYFGGVIAPGINLSLRALFMAAAKLPRIEIQAPERVIGKSTVAAMESGIFWGYLSMIEGMVARICEEYGQPMQVIATGGLASLFFDATSVISHNDRTLTIEGLVYIHGINNR